MLYQWLTYPEINLCDDRPADVPCFVLYKHYSLPLSADPVPRLIKLKICAEVLVARR